MFSVPMKASQLNKAPVILITIFVIGLSLPNTLMAQDGSPDLYNGPINDPIEEEYNATETAIDDEVYIYEEQYFQEEEQYYEAEIKEDTASVSMLTFNFLFYIVYKLKFSEVEDKQETTKTADDD